MAETTVKRQGLRDRFGERREPRLAYDAGRDVWVLLGLWREDWHRAKKRGWKRANNAWEHPSDEAARHFRRYAENDAALERLGYFRNPAGHICLIAKYEHKRGGVEARRWKGETDG